MFERGRTNRRGSAAAQAVAVKTGVVRGVMTMLPCSLWWVKAFTIVAVRPRVGCRAAPGSAGQQAPIADLRAQGRGAACGGLPADAAVAWVKHGKQVVVPRRLGVNWHGALRCNTA